MIDLDRQTCVILSCRRSASARCISDAPRRRHFKKEDAMILPMVASVLCAALIVPSTNKQEDQALAGYVKVEIQGVLQVEDGSLKWSAIVDDKRVFVTITAPGPRDMHIRRHNDGSPPRLGFSQEFLKKPAGITWELVLGRTKDFHDFVKVHKGQMVAVKGTIEIIEEYGGPDGKGEKMDPWANGHGNGPQPPPPSPRIMVKVTELQLAKTTKK
jgi:hypothetical protein